MGQPGQDFDDDPLSEWFEVLQTLAAIEPTAVAPVAPVLPEASADAGPPVDAATPPAGMSRPVTEMSSKRNKNRQNPALTVAALLFVAVVGAIAWAGHLHSPARRSPGSGLSSTPSAPFTTVVDSTSVPTTIFVFPVDTTVAPAIASTTTRVTPTVVRPTTATTRRAPATTTTTRPVTKKTFVSTTSSTRPAAP